MNENILVPVSPYETATALFETGAGSESSLGPSAHRPLAKRKQDKRRNNFFGRDFIE
jgi:hypothetical protein